MLTLHRAGPEDHYGSDPQEDPFGTPKNPEKWRIRAFLSFEVVSEFGYYQATVINFIHRFDIWEGLEVRLNPHGGGRPRGT
jgi:hypothetical protein